MGNENKREYIQDEGKEEIRALGKTIGPTLLSSRGTISSHIKLQGKYTAGSMVLHKGNDTCHTVSYMKDMLK